ncbi:MAG TPA: pyridoxal 5'-phosphate synthase glutaminase subunit PdxT [Propionicimonas sp.]|nr:pyridoxal 5'-phosphate synthase glutaminase subunit PdxT [Propionicimonas sp.]
MTNSGAFGGPTVGVLALQGGVAEHVELLETLGARVAAVRTPRDLIGSDGFRVDAIVLPGGESSVIDRLLRTFELFEPLREAIVGGLPTLATCAGLILLAEEVLDPAPGQQSLHVMDITVRRNAFGPQVASSVESLETTDGPVSVAFIRAPEVVRTGPGVAVVARRGPAIVAVRQRAITGLAFHPELTGETRFHRQLLGQVEASARAS